MTNSPSSFDCANAIRALSMDAVQKANSGHPGMPMGMADIAEVLWRRYLRYNPKNPGFYNRDRFVLSNGHGAMLLYSLLYLTGYDVNIDDLKNFRQFHSKTPGHPEFGDTPGVETTTGPLGQGLANAVGMALAEKTLAAQFNKDDFNIVDHFTYVFVGDGCLMEGISHEACSLAGTFQLGKLIVFYDDNGISIDGEVEAWFTDDTVKRFEAYGWQVIADVDGHNTKKMEEAIDAAQANRNQPTLICCKTQIGFGSPNKANTADAHGAPLGEDEIKLVRKQLGWTHEPFFIPDEIKQAFDHTIKGIEEEAIWAAVFAQYETKYPKLASEFLRRMQGHLPPHFSNAANTFINELQKTQKEMATRKASLVCIEEFARYLPELMGGSADLSGSNCTNWKACRSLNKNPDGNYIEYGVREFAMSAMMNGIALHGGFIPFGGTFLTFTDYARNALRLSALMRQRVIYIYTHDSIGLGEDGPTHQPIEHAAMLRMTPNLNVWRPADAVETAVAWNHALHYRGPSALLLSRQNLPPLSRSISALQDASRGAYVLFEADRENIDAIIMATGSEVFLALEAAKKMQEQRFAVRVVSMPSADVFKQQDADYRELVLPKKITKRLAVEAGVSDYWYQFVGLDGAVIGIDHFGASAPANILFKEYGFTVDNVVKQLMTLLSTVVEV